MDENFIVGKSNNLKRRAGGREHVVCCRKSSTGGILAAPEMSWRGPDAIGMNWRYGLCRGRRSEVSRRYWDVPGRIPGCPGNEGMSWDVPGRIPGCPGSTGMSWDVPGRTPGCTREDSGM